MSNAAVNNISATSVQHEPTSSIVVLTLYTTIPEMNYWTCCIQFQPAKFPVDIQDTF